MTLRPLHDQVIVELEDAPDTTPSGLTLITDPSTPRKGVVKAVGPGIYVDGVQIPVSVKEGERVLLRSQGGIEITDVLNTSSPKVLIVRDVELLCAIDD